MVLTTALLALYAFRLAGAWHWAYVISAILALYLNVFVGVVQGFQKVAPTQSELPFILSQTVVLAIFTVLGYLAVKKFHPVTGRLGGSIPARGPAGDSSHSARQ